MIQANELTRITVNRSYRDHWIGKLNNVEAVYDVIWEYDNGGVTQEQVIIPLFSFNREGIDRLATIQNELKKFQRVETSDTQRVFIPG